MKIFQSRRYRPFAMRNINSISNSPSQGTLACTVAFVTVLFASWNGVALAQQPQSPPPYQTQSQVPVQNVQFQAPGSNLPTLGAPGFQNPSIINAPPPIAATPPGTVSPTPIPYSPQGTVPPPAITPQGIVPSPSPTMTPGYDPFQTNNVVPLPNFGTPQAQPPVIIPPIVPSYQPQLQVSPGVPSQVGIACADANDWWPENEWPSIAWSRLRHDPTPRVLQGLRFRYTYIYGNSGNELGVNDAEIATTWVFANFMGGSHGLRVTPGFIFHFWSGPDTAATGVDLPARTYDAYLTSDYVSDTTKQSGIDSNVTILFSSDFNAVTSDSLRLTGTILGWQQVNSYTTAKLGVEYYDRIDVKILPAFGIYMTPNSDLKFDLYFPRPKLAQRIPNSSGFEVWAYVGAEYGGGNWTIRRQAGFNDRVDVNDVRAFFGAEWMGPKGSTGFMELGYVFQRNLVYRSDVNNKTILQDSIMLRSGFAF